MPNPIEAAAGAPRRRFRPRSLPTLTLLATVAVCVWAGGWQQRRMHEKEALRVQFDAAQRMAPAAFAGLPGTADWAAWRFRPVVAEGEYVARAQIYIDNRIHGGRAGYHVVTPLALADGRTVLVNRGWVAPGASRAQLPEAPPPGGSVTVAGRLGIAGPGFLELKPDTAAGPVWQNLDPARFAAATGIRVLPAVIEATGAPVPGDRLVRDWPAPDFGVEKHRIYMVQWYAFGAVAVVLWLVLNLRRARPRDHG